MVDKTDTEDLIRLLELLILERDANRHVLKHSGLEKWAVHLADYREVKANRLRAHHSLDAVRETLQGNPTDADILRSLRDTLAGIVQVYPSQERPL